MPIELIPNGVQSTDFSWVLREGGPN